MKHYKYPKIRQFRDAVKQIQHLAMRTDKVDEQGNPIMNRGARTPVVEFRGSVKLHGTNAAWTHGLKVGSKVTVGRTVTTAAGLKVTTYHETKVVRVDRFWVWVHYSLARVRGRDGSMLSFYKDDDPCVLDEDHIVHRLWAGWDFQPEVTFSGDTDGRIYLGFDVQASRQKPELIESLVRRAYDVSRAQGFGLMHYREYLPEPDLRRVLDSINWDQGPGMFLAVDYLVGRSVKLFILKDDGGQLYVANKWFDHTMEDQRQMLPPSASRTCARLEARTP